MFKHLNVNINNLYGIQTQIDILALNLLNRIPRHIFGQECKKFENASNCIGPSRLPLKKMINIAMTIIPVRRDDIHNISLARQI
jgi:hypothetical protein